MTGPDDGNLRRVLGLGLAVAVLLGIAAAGGSIVRGTSTEATTRQAFPYALMGALASTLLAGIVIVAIRAVHPGSFRHRPMELLAIAFIVAALGALLGAALTPRTPNVSEVSALDHDEIERRQERSGAFDESTRAGPVDRDGDGRPDTDANGDMIVGYDLDGDGRLEGYLQPCPDDTPVPEPWPGYTPIDDDCDGTVDEWLPFDPDSFLQSDSEPSAAPPATISPEERQERADRQGAAGQRSGALGKLLLVILAVAICAAIIVWLVRMPDRSDEDDDGATGDDLAPPDAPALDLSRSFEASLDAMLDGPDPRQAICAAYGQLLGGFAEVGLPRRTEEAPEEHARRCLAAAHMEPRPVRELLDLFALARFSTHPVDESHRLAAVRAMRAALASAGTGGASTPTPAPTDSPASVPVGAGWGPPKGDR